MTRPIRVAMVIPRYHPIFGGAENQCRLLIAALGRDGRAVPAFVLTRRLTDGLPSEDTVDGVPVSRIGRPGLDRWGEYDFYMRTIATLLKRRTEFDVIHAHATSLCGVAAALAGDLSRAGVVLKLSSNGEFATGFVQRSQSPTNDPGGPVPEPTRDRSVAGRLRRPLVAATCRRAQIVALNAEGEAELALGGARYAHVIPNAVDTVHFRPPTAAERARVRESLDIAPDAYCFVYTGRFVASKGLDTLLSALAGGALSEHPALREPDAGARRDVAVVLVGSGALQDAAVTLDAGAGRIVRVVEPTLDVRPYLWAADAFVFPSRREGMPNAVLEALATGLPVVLSDIAPHRELLAQSPQAWGALHTVGDAASLRAALARCVAHASSSVGRARGVLDVVFEPDAVAARYVAVYRASLEVRAGTGGEVRPFSSRRRSAREAAARSPKESAA